MEDISPLEKFGVVEKDCPIYAYFHLYGNQKVSTQNKVQSTSSDGSITYESSSGDSICGSPLYCEDKLVGLNIGESKDGVIEAKSIQIISNWIRENNASFHVGDEVMATWTDGFEYKAEIKEVTETGYIVYYTGFNCE